jgi:sulfoacetaldehyde acetyltransferase
VVVITPIVPSTLAGTGAFQEIDQMDMLRSVTVDQFSVSRPDRIGECIRSTLALGDPVQIDIPRDYFYSEWNELELSPSQYRTDGKRGGAPVDAINAAADLLADAKSPVIFAGLGVIKSGTTDNVRALAEKLGAPLANIFKRWDK